MPSDLDDLLFLPLDLPDPVGLLNEVLAYRADHWIPDSYRNCSLLPLHNKGGLRQETENLRQSSLTCEWIPDIQKHMPRLVEYCENCVFPFMDIRPRAMII